MEQKKPTNAQLQRRIQNAIVFVPKAKDTLSIYFSDKGLRLTVTTPSDYGGYAVIETNYHRHVFDELNPNASSLGVYNPLDEKWVNLPFSRPYIYTKRVIEIATENDCKTDSCYSFAKLLETLKAKEDQTEYNIVVYYEWWLQLIFSYLYSIDESEAGSFLVYEAYLHHIARNGILLSEKKEDITNKQFVEQVTKSMLEFIEGIDERVIFPKKTDEELVQANIEAIQEQQANEAMEGE